MARDYAAEYARRRLLEAERAEREGREFNLSRARGHDSREYEREQRRRARERKRNQPGTIATPSITPLEFWTRRTHYSIDLSDYRDMIAGAVENLTETMGLMRARQFMVDRLRTKYDDTQQFLQRISEGREWGPAVDSSGNDRPNTAAFGSFGNLHYFTGRVEFLPVEVYWYHGGGG